jgi:methanogenic corrinoid protein MtbC1
MSEFSLKASKTLDKHRQELAELIVARQYDLEADFWTAFGPRGREKSIRDMGYHLSYLSEALAVSDPQLFAHYVDWAGSLFTGLGFPDEVMVTMLNCIREVLGDQLPPELGAVTDQYLVAGLKALQQASPGVATFLEPDGPLAGLAQQYLDALLRGERQAASRLILDAVDRGIEIKEIYLHVFQRTQQEIGRLWQMNQVSVAQEHYCTAATQLIMSQLCPHIFTMERVGRQMVAACVGGELHELGIRMVADFFEMDGWDTYYLGANTPAESVVDAIIEREATLIAVSATMTFHIRDVTSMIAQIRASRAGSKTKILVGGYPFNLSPDLWHRVGADGHALDAEAAVALANRLTADE